MPSSIACSSRPSQPSPSTPPRFVVPTIMVLTPAAAASSTVMSGSRKSALQPGRRNCPRQTSGRQNAMPSAVLAASWSGASPMNSRYGVRIVTGGPPCWAAGISGREFKHPRPAAKEVRGARSRKGEAWMKPFA